MNFNKKFDTYDENAIIQKIVASHLIELIKETKNDKSSFESVLEVGCGTGIFTRDFLNNYSPKKIILNDIFQVKKFLNNIPYNSFLLGDILKLEISNIDTVISSSVFQWISPFEELIKKLSFCENLYFSIYISGNLKEIDEHFNISLDYFEVEEIENILKKYFTKVKYKKESIPLEFNTPLAALKHLKNSGVTGFKKSSISKIKSFSSKTLTYEIGYFLCEK